jgi:hypothetical protein
MSGPLARAEARKLAFHGMAGGSMGDVMEELHKEGHIRSAHYVAVCKLLDDMRRSHGTSAGIVSMPSERVDTSIRDRLAPPGGGDQDAFARMSKALERLRSHERELLAFLVLQRELARGALSDYGRQWSSYKTNKTTRAVAVGKVSSLAASIAEAYSAA